MPAIPNALSNSLRQTSRSHTSRASATPICLYLRLLEAKTKAFRAIEYDSTKLRPELRQ